MQSPNQPPFAAQLYRLSLRAYPAAFRERHGGEMVRIFSDDWRAARHAGSRATVALAGHIASDFARTVPHERLVALTLNDWLAGGTATVCGTTATGIDFAASEVQSTLLVFLAGTIFFSYFAETRTWRWPVAVAAWLPATHAVAATLGVEKPASALLGSTVMLPALAMFGAGLAVSLAGAGVGVWLRRAFPLCLGRGGNCDQMDANKKL